MTSLTAELDRIAPSRRPRGQPAGYHRWSDLVFIHWRLPADEIAPLLPPQLTLDTWQGDAWVGLVPFRMSGVRPWWWPRGAAFLETNVRTYVHFRGRDPGVWFFSLEANHRLAVMVARACWHLNYYWAEMTLRREGDVLTYASQRRAAGGSSSRIVARIRAATPPCQAATDTLEHFLVERYLLYAVGAGRLWRGQVHHQPYVLQPAELIDLQESLLATNGIDVSDGPCHLLYSPRVDVEVFPLVGVASAGR
jgi:uncharacterized protein YqjF (DUF2071 family)